MRLLLLSIIFSLLSCSGFAQRAKYFEVGINGSYSKSHSTHKVSTLSSLGVDISIPFSYFFELSFGHTVSIDRDTYNQAYKDYMNSKGYVLPEGDIESVDQILDTFVNAVFAYPMGYLKPWIFGGQLWRKICQEDTYQDYGCSDMEPTWNAGIGLSFYLTMRLRLKGSYRISPYTGDEDGSTLDEKVSLGISWSY